MSAQHHKGWVEGREHGTNGTFRKKRSGVASKRTQSSYTLRGRDLSVQQTLRKLAKQFKTLGSGNLLRIVDIPEETIQECMERCEEKYPDLAGEALKAKAVEEATNEWIAANTVDFYNEVALLYGLVEDFHQKASNPLSYAALAEQYKTYKPKFPGFFNGFPQGFEYRLKEANGKVSKPDGAEYVNMSMIWLEDQIDNSQIFPEMEDDPFPAKFIDTYVTEMFKRMFRIFAIIYAVCWPFVVENEAEAHVNTCFKHFYFFMKKFNLLKKSQDKDVFVKTKVKNIINLEALDVEYKNCLAELAKEA